MKNRKAEGLLLIIAGLVIIGSAFFIYFYVDKTYPDSSSSRVQQLNWLLNTFGKTGTTALLAVVGLVPVYFGVRKLRN